MGFVIPIAIAIPSLAYISRVLGVELFGVYTICFFIIGYASILDLGFSRAITKYVAKQAEQAEKGEVSLHVLTSAAIPLLLFSFFIALIVNLNISGLIVLLNISFSLIHDVEKSLFVLGVLLPVCVSTQILYGWLEGVGAFKLLGYQRTLTGSLITLLPVIFLMNEISLYSAMLGVATARIITLLVSIYTVTCTKVIYNFKPRYDVLKVLFTTGGWITVSNIISPIMTYIDRFFIATTSSAYMAGLYAAPSEVISKMNVLPNSISRVFFSMQSAKERDNYLQKSAYILMAVAVLIPLIPIYYFSEEILVLWLGDSFKGTPSDVLKILCLGFLFNSLAQIPYSKLQASGHAKSAALLHSVEILPFIFLLYILVNNFGLIGAATAWSLRVFLDFISLLLMSNYYES